MLIVLLCSYPCVSSTATLHIYSVAEDYFAVLEKNLWLFYISGKSVENFREFFKFSGSFADNALFVPQRK